MKLTFVLTAAIISFSGFQNLWADPAATQALATELSHDQRIHGDFKQTISDSKGAVSSQSSGHFALARPSDSSEQGKFRWEIITPSPQLLIANGSEIFLYDTQLQQVTEKKQQSAVKSNSPAMLLSGDFKKISDQYQVSVKQNAKQFVYTLTPLKDTFFSKATITFKDNTLSGMTIHDHLGQVTEILFSNIKPEVAKDAFTFKVPAGVDVIKGM
jgi:outer membrane lipoprotein carrier protein